MRSWLTGLLLLVSVFIFAQGKYDANWCFGINAGVKFNDTAPPINFTTLCNDPLAAASISDSLGNLLFYIAPDTPFNVNGIFYTENAIYDKDNQVIRNGDSLVTGTDLTGAIFLPVPQTSNSYYVFYMDRAPDIGDTLYCSIIVQDTTGYELIKKNSILSTFPLEWRMGAVKHANGNDWWLVAHQYDFDSATSRYYEFLITRDSILGPYSQDIGSVHSSEDVSAGQLKFSRDGNWLASALGDQNGVDLFNFNRCTGQLENFISLDSIDSLGGDEITDCEFSEDGTKLYVSEGFGDVSSKSALYQYDLTSSNINASKITLFRTDSNQTTFGDLKRADNNKIYLAVEYRGIYPYHDTTFNQWNQYLWVINDPDSSGTACNFQPYAYYLGDSARVYWALPNMPNYNLGALSIYQGTGKDTTICNTDSITIGNPPVANVTYAWQPAVGITDTTLSQQTVKPDSSTWYYVTLTDTTINYSCQSVTDSFFVQVVHCCDSLSLSQSTLSKDTFICTNIDTPTKGAILLVDTVPGVSFAWQPAAGISVHATEQIVDPSQSTWYYVTFYSDTDSASACNQRKDSVYVEVKKCMVGIDEISLASQHLNIYPNPAQNIVTIEWSSNGASDANIVVYDVLGREVKKASLSGAFGMAQIDVSDLANGLYVVRLLSPSGGGEGGGSGKLTVIK